MTMVIDDVQTREARHVLQTYRRQPVTFVRGEGVRLYDAEGREYLDLLSGIGVASLGHAHPGLARAIAEQAQTLLHTSNLFYHPLQGQLAERLASLSGLPRAFFCNSGTEAVEACLKFARRYWYTRGEPRSRDHRARGVVPRPDVRRAVGHLRRALPRAVRAAAAGRDVSSRPTIRRRCWRRSRSDTAAIIVEPIQGEGGVRPLTPAFAAAINEASRQDRRAAHRRRSAVRAGPHRPSVLLRGARPRAGPGSLGKALGGGVPVGAALVSEEVARRHRLRRSRQHLRRQPAGLPRRAVLPRRAGRRRADRAGRPRRPALRAAAARDWPARHPIIKEVRGAGLMWGSS